MTDNNLNEQANNSCMKQEKNWTLLTAIIAIMAIVLCALLVRRCNEDKALVDVSIVNSKAIDLTPVQIRSIENIGEWEFLAIDDEELVDSTRHRTLGKDARLVRIYRGTLRLGIDMRQVKEGWIATQGDTVALQVPQVRLLSERFIDEARTRSFYESGTWSAQAKEQMYHKAARQMKKRCLTPDNIKQAQDNAQEQLAALFRTFGFNTVEISFN